jgi:hypothetical protein
VRGRKLIVVHPCATGYICFDIFCGYRVEDCPVVKRIGVEDYVCSEDLAHPPHLNMAVLKTIIKLIKMGFEVEFVDIEE